MLLPLSSCDSSFMVGTWSHRRANNIVVCGPVYLTLRGVSTTQQFPRTMFGHSLTVANIYSCRPRVQER